MEGSSAFILLRGSGFILLKKKIEDVGGEKVRDTEEKIKFCLN